MKYNSLQQAVIDVLQEKKITHPNQQAIDVHEPEKDEITADDFKKLRSMKKTPSGKLHNCATHVEHTLYGEGQCIKEAHADPDAEGNIAWYTVQFKDGTVRKVQTESMKIVASEGHVHETVNSEEEQIDEARFKKGQDVGKPGLNFKKIAAKAAAKYGSAEAGKRVAGAVLKKVLAKEENELDEAMSQQASTTMKHIANPTAGEKKAAKDIKPGVAGYRDRIAMLKSAEARGALKKEEVEQADEAVSPQSPHNDLAGRIRFSPFNKTAAGKKREFDRGTERLKDKMKFTKSQGGVAGPKGKLPEEVEQGEQVEETLEFHDAFTVELKESYTFGEYLTAAKKLVGEEQAINLANKAFQEQDISIFIEEYSHSAVEDKVKAHMNAGHKVTMPKYTTRDGKPRAEYVVTDKESGVRRKYIHQGNVVKMENMGAKGKKD